MDSMGGPAEDPNVYYREGWSPSHDVPMDVARVWASPRGFLRHNESWVAGVSDGTLPQELIRTQRVESLDGWS